MNRIEEKIKMLNDRTNETIDEKVKMIDNKVDEIKDTERRKDAKNEEFNRKLDERIATL